MICAMIFVCHLGKRIMAVNHSSLQIIITMKMFPPIWIIGSSPHYFVHRVFQTPDAQSQGHSNHSLH